MSKRQKNTSVSTYSRMLWADVIRIVAIYFVVHLHTAFVPFDKVSVPLFVMVSGALLLDKQESAQLFFRKRSLKVLLPWIAWTIIYMIYFLYYAPDQQAIRNEFFNGNIESGSFTQWMYYFGRMFLSALWFLPMIFSLYLLTPLFRIVLRNSGSFEKYYMITLWFIFFSLLPIIINSSLFPKYEPNLFFTAFQYSGYFILGYLLTKLKTTKNILVSFSLLLLTAALFIREESGFIDPQVVFTSAAFFYLVFCLSNIFDKYVNKRSKTIIALISGACFGIYVIHGIIGGLWGPQIKQSLQIVNLEFAVSVVLFSVSAIIILILQKIPVIKRIVP